MTVQVTIPPTPAPVVSMLTPEEESIVLLLAQIVVDSTLNQTQHESHQVPPLQ